MYNARVLDSWSNLSQSTQNYWRHKHIKQNLAPSISGSNMCKLGYVHQLLKCHYKCVHIFKQHLLGFFCWKRVWCLAVMSLILHLSWIRIGLRPWAVTVLCWPFSLCVRTIIPTYRHLKTSLSCPGSLFHKKNDCIVAFTSYGNNFCGDLTVKSIGSALFLRWKSSQSAKFFPRTCPCLCRIKT